VKKVLIESMDFFANPGTIHSDGVIAKKKLEEAREKIAAAIFSRAKEIIFTGSATESNNLAVFGSIFAWRSQHPGKMPHIIMTSIEHPSILEVCNHLEEKGLAEIPMNLAMFFGLYFVMTGLHGIHVTVGIGLLYWTIRRLDRGDFGPKKYNAVEGVGLYWHLVDLIWIYLFPLLYLVL
jgi:hypothetical protein